MIDLQAIRARCEKACQMVSDLCKPKGTVGARDWIMRIPAERDYDPDLVIGDSLQDIPLLLTAIEQRDALLRRCLQLAGCWTAESTHQLLNDIAALLAGEGGKHE